VHQADDTIASFDLPITGSPKRRSFCCKVMDYEVLEIRNRWETAQNDSVLKATLQMRSPIFNLPAFGNCDKISTMLFFRK
jgi:hypothetical protein